MGRWTKHWSRREIQSYKQIRSAYLSSLYREAGIPATDPERRVDCVYPHLFPFEEDIFHSTVRCRGKAEGLNLLERLLDWRHKEKITVFRVSDNDYDD